MTSKIRSNPIVAAERCLDAIRQKTDTVILMCSLGKDSLVTLDLAYPKFKKVICVFMYFVKGLEHIEHWISWVKVRYPNVEFVQVPHFSLSYVLHFGSYCVANPKVRLLNLNKVVSSLKLKYHVEYVLLGMKICDSMNRNLMIKQLKANNYINDASGMCYPLAEFTQKQILAYMRMHKLPKPVMYGQGVKGGEVGTASNGISLNLDCFVWLEQHYPQDLERIYAVFPQSVRILQEYHYHQQEKEKETEDG